MRCLSDCRLKQCFDVETMAMALEEWHLKKVSYVKVVCKVTSTRRQIRLKASLHPSPSRISDLVSKAQRGSHDLKGPAAMPFTSQETGLLEGKPRFQRSSEGSDGPVLAQMWRRLMGLIGTISA